MEKLGEGGMGTVYLAEHVLIRKKVALKVLNPDLARRLELIARFLQEAKAAATIGHENIVDITDFGETPSGSAYIAMEFLDGKDLAGHLIESGAMPFERALPIAIQICRALEAAHEKGIIHRDLKPENIFLITRGGRPDFVKVLDFGIAKVVVPDQDQKLTVDGTILGTPEYMSPEQARGEQVDHRIDVYALGCILYQMLTGKVPLRGENFMATLSAHMFTMPHPPSQRMPQANIPPALEAVVMKALAKDREERFTTMEEMAKALEACERAPTSVATAVMPEVPILLVDVARPVPTVAPTTARPAHGKKWLLVAALLLIVGGAVIVGWQRLTSNESVGTGEDSATPPVEKKAAVPRIIPAPAITIVRTPDMGRLEGKPVSMPKSQVVVAPPKREVQRSSLPKLPTPPPSEEETPRAAEYPPPEARPEPPKQKKGLLEGVLENPFERQKPPE
ncbi:MAG: serine/threonine-protein kinase [Candidatus Uhrbacteria bacterium]|nr:serine/threonine-protein kinase [Candidatus Uhrbacteria bacterium]